jgi:hypothetical protein
MFHDADDLSPLFGGAIKYFACFRQELDALGRTLQSEDFYTVVAAVEKTIDNAIVQVPPGSTMRLYFDGPEFTSRRSSLALMLAEQLMRKRRQTSQSSGV